MKTLFLALLLIASTASANNTLTILQGPTGPMIDECFNSHDSECEAKKTIKEASVRIEQQKLEQYIANRCIDADLANDWLKRNSIAAVNAAIKKWWNQPSYAEYHGVCKD